MNATQVEAVVNRLSAIYRQAQQLRFEQPRPVREFTAQQLGSMAIRSRIAAVDDAESGMCYAAWVIGETLAIAGGDTLMHQVFDRFEDANGVRGASWLDHRWNGVTAPGVLWAA